MNKQGISSQKLAALTKEIAAHPELVALLILRIETFLKTKGKIPPAPPER